MPTVTDLLKARYPSIFAETASGFTLDLWQIKALDFKGDRLILNCSRQVGKTFVAAALALHTAIYFPESLTLLESITLDQAMEVFEEVTKLLPHAGIPTPLELNKKSLRLQNNSRIRSLSSAEGSVRGYTPDLVIVDEASRCEDIMYRSLRPCLAVSKGRLILLSSPNWAEGFFWKEWEQGSEPWIRISIPAEECPRISPEFLEAERFSLLERVFEREYHCKFLEPEGALFSADILSKARTVDVKPYFNKEALIESKIERYNYGRAR